MVYNLVIKNTNIDEIVRKIFYKVNVKHVLLSYFRQNMCYGDQNCLILKQEDQFGENDENRGTKTAIK
jgi:hypothetical protein